MRNHPYRNYLRTAVLVAITAGCASELSQSDSPAPPPTTSAIAVVDSMADSRPSAGGPVPAQAPPRAANITYIDEPTLSERETITWAVGRFAAAGLELPDLDVRFPVYCKGKGAIYHIGESSVDFCRVNKKNVLHEFAHAWDDTSGDVDREGFLELRGLDIWFGGLDVPCEEQGSEHLAIVIAWGLMEPGTRSAHGLPHNSDAELHEAFEFLTDSTPGEPVDEAIRRRVSAEPSVVIDGGTPERRHTVIDAVDRYLSVGLALPDLRVRIHLGGKSGCGGFQGLFHPDGHVGVIDLCYPGEFLALHELGHAWEHFNLDDRQRAEFERLTGLTTWRSTDVVWRDRGVERAANVLAHGLLSTPLATARYHALDFELFDALTGVTTPRLAEIDVPDVTVPPLDHEELTRLAAYEAWRHAQGGR